MKQYVTVQEYADLGGQMPVNDPHLLDWIRFATIKVDEMTFRKIGPDLARLTPFQQELVKKATVVQTDYLNDLANTTGLDFDAASWSITDVSMSYGGDTSTPSKRWHKEQNHSSMALAYLAQSGLTWPGV